MCFPDYQWESLGHQVRATQSQAFAESTKSNISTHVKAYCYFCIYFGIPVFPASHEALSRFVQVLQNSFKSPVSVYNYVSGLQSAHRVLGYEFPDIKSYEFTFQFKGGARILQHLPSKAQPLTTQILTNIYKLLNMNDHFHVSFWAALLLGFLSFSRLASLLPKSAKSYSPTLHLSRQSIKVFSSHVQLNFSHSKTRQLGNHVHQVPLSAVPGSHLCPVMAVNNMLQLSPVSPQSPAFSYLLASAPCSLIQHQFIDTLRLLLSWEGIPESKFSGHSLRRGGASHAFNTGVRSELIKLHGDWRSSAYLGYLEMCPNTRLQVSRNMIHNP